jgi:serine/threonine protein kinase/dienelactone hydrolase
VSTLPEELIFAAAIEKPNPERLSFLDRACGGNAALRAQVEALLAAHDRPESLLAGPAFEATLPAAPEIAERPGVLIGSYKLLQQIGEGGFGVVFMAEQERPVRRLVALKIIKPGMDTREVIARFESERQALALMDHPNIARVFDAGATKSGRPYFVMELVKGVPITEFCDKNQFPAEKRLELFITVCQAIQHAHQKGVIHRDIKPSNVMVTLHDGVPVVKVIDFGVAKATAQKLTERTLFTAYGQMIGTPAYMSPEQAEMSGLDIDTRSDVYSLGVLLYELLTGTPPLDNRQIRSAGYAEIQRLIREQEPPRPSTRISTQGGQASITAASRGTDVKRLCQLLRGDLDVIVMKSLSKDRNRRYESPAGFAADLGRFLRHEAIEARPPSALYKLRKFARRNRVAVAITTLLAVLLVIAGSLGWLAYLGERRRGELTEEMRRAEEVRRGEEWARNVALPQIERLIDEKHIVAAFRLAKEAHTVIPGNPRLAAILEQSTAVATLHIEPPGTRVFVRDWDANANDWLEVGRSPLENVRLPRGDMRWKLVREGYVTEETLRAFPDIAWVQFHLFREADLPAAMIAIPSGKANPHVGLHENVGGFCIDRFEVTNRDYQRFVDAGGYQNPEYWKHEFLRDGKAMTREEAVATFCDQTGKPGPATWSNGHFPDGEDEFPVRGVSWYEAAACAEFQGKTLPTVHHWWWAGHGKVELMVPLANFANRGPAGVGSYPAIGFFGAYDMAGNVAEWCSNEGAEGKRMLRGGAWNEPVYMFTDDHADAPLARAPTYGFRCVRYFEKPSAAALAPYRRFQRHYDEEPAATADELTAHLTHFAYDKQRPLHHEIRASDCEPAAAYRHDVVQIDAAYGAERFDIHLYFPRDGESPYETIVWLPGAGAFQLFHFSEHSKLVETEIERAFVRTGRALCMPIYKGSYERNTPELLDFATVHGRTWFIQLAQDLSRAVDYLGTRSDIDSERLIYSGLSFGAAAAPVLLVAEPRFQAAVLISGGYHSNAAMTEIEPRRYTPHVKLPVLMVGGLLDAVFPVEASQLPMYRHLGSPDKQIKHFQSGHIPPVEETIKFADEWLRSRTGARSKANPDNDQ